MSVGRWAVAAACCALFAPAAWAEKTATADSKLAASHAEPAAGQATPTPAAARERSWPRLLPVKGAAAAKPAVPAQWTPEEIALAQARCTAMLKGIDAIAVPETPIREGSECGTAAPMKLISVGRNPPVALSPPPVVTCDLIAALSRWMARDIQPLARKHLGAPVIRIETMSSYSCRNAYGRKDSRLSEHGRANAVDIGAFVTARGQAALVVADWGPTAREAAEQAAIARAQTEPGPAQASASKFARPLAAPEGASAAGQAALVPVAPAPQGILSGATISIPGLSINIGGASAGASTGFGLAPPSRLGGPKPATVPPALPPGPVVLPQVKTQFLHAAHRSACKVFGTVLGPEANKAHKNHFHVDMAERKSAVICE